MMIPRYLILFYFVILATSCRNKKAIPDVSGIKVELQTIRFEKEFFSLDTSDPVNAYRALMLKYPGFAPLFASEILGIPANDSTGMASRALRQFISDYRPIKEMSDREITDIRSAENEIRKGLQFLKHYFPSYETPKKLYTFIGPLDAYAEGQTGGYGDIITPDGLAVGLQLHLGSNSDVYLSEQGQRLYPTYISRRFEPQYIPVNCMKNIIDDIFPPSSSNKTLLDIMVDKGKRLYMLDLLMPNTADSLKTGYTEKQLKGAFENEGLIWNFFLQNNLIYETDLMKIRSYIGDGPSTMELGEGSPGYISLFTGRQIVRAYMERNPGRTLPELLGTDAKTILNGSGYRPG